MVQVGLQMFTSWVHPKSRFQKSEIEKVADMKPSVFGEEWDSFRNHHGEVMDIIDELPYFQCCSPASSTGNGWGNHLTSKKDGLLPAMGGIMFTVGLMKRHKSMKDAGLSGSKLSGSLKGDAMKLIDRLVYERLEGHWKGTGDSTAATKIEAYKDHKNSIVKVPEKEWETLIAKLCWGDGAIPKGTGTFRADGPELTSMGQPYCGGDEIGKYATSASKQKFPSQVMQFLIHYYYLRNTDTPIKKWMGVDAKKYQWDHIIPESEIHSLGDDSKSFWCNNLSNCCVLPSHKNLAKSNHCLNSTWCKKNDKMIEKYTGIDKKEQKKYDKGSKLQPLCVDRGSMLIDQFLNARKF